MTELSQGVCDPAFSKVREIFNHNLSEEGELGAACSIYVEGKKVVDLWGGHCDEAKAKPWLQDTLVGFYSVGKPLGTLGMLQQIEQGRLELDQPVARYWPEFAAANKESITLRQLMSHQGGLPAISKRLPEGAMLDWEQMTQALAEQEPWFEPGSKAVYHTNTFGYLTCEPVRRVTGLSAGDYFQKHIAGPLGEELYFGVPSSELSRVADIRWHAADMIQDPDMFDKPLSELEKMVRYSYFNPSGFSSLGVMNTAPWRQAAVPSTNGHGTARGIAKLYHVLAQGGDYEGVHLLDTSILKEASRCQAENTCPILQRPVCFGLGFQRTRDYRPFGPNAQSFGHFGSGGSLGFADPDCKLGFGYVMNDIVPRWQNTRNEALLEAVYQCL